MCHHIMFTWDQLLNFLCVGRKWGDKANHHSVNCSDRWIHGLHLCLHTQEPQPPIPSFSLAWHIVSFSLTYHLYFSIILCRFRAEHFLWDFCWPACRFGICLTLLLFSKRYLIWSKSVISTCALKCFKYSILFLNKVIHMKMYFKIFHKFW